MMIDMTMRHRPIDEETGHITCLTAAAVADSAAPPVYYDGRAVLIRCSPSTTTRSPSFDAVFNDPERTDAHADFHRAKRHLLLASTTATL